VNLPVSADDAFAWHERPGALERLMPPWESMYVLRQTGGIANGDSVEFLIHIGPFAFKWLAELRDYEKGRQFRDIAIRSPFASWDHLHSFESLGPKTCRLEDRIEYSLPGGLVGQRLAAAFTEKQLHRMFHYRHDTTVGDLTLHATYADRPRLKIAITGSTGLIGSSLTPFLTSGGHQVHRIRRQSNSDNFWEQTPLEADAVIHLAGENVAVRWTPVKQTRIRYSRVEGTRALCHWLAKLEHPPKVLICASAAGYYGNRGEETLDEQSAPGNGFLADVAQAWEKAAEVAQIRGIRVVFLRLGMILSPRGGSLAKLLLPFKCGAGGPMGNGRQYWSWISIDDVLGAIYHALMTDTLAGPVNVVAPRPVTNHEFAATLGSVLRRPTLISMPASVLKSFLGKMAEELLLSSARVLPQQLLLSGYRFGYPELNDTLKHLLGRYQ
jgi:uncharacterized protein